MLSSRILGQSTEIRYRAIVFGAIGALFSISSVVGPILGGKSHLPMILFMNRGFPHFGLLGAFTTHLSCKVLKLERL